MYRAALLHLRVNMQDTQCLHAQTGTTLHHLPAQLGERLRFVAMQVFHT